VYEKTFNFFKFFHEKKLSTLLKQLSVFGLSQYEEIGGNVFKKNAFF